VHEDQTPPPVDATRELETIRANLREIAHEINNPLGVLRMTAYFLEKGDVTPEKLAEYAGLINQSLDRIENNMKRLNDLRRSGSAPSGGA
jgi:nitrogen-specific signal transduction histidine kinase